MKQKSGKLDALFSAAAVGLFLLGLVSSVGAAGPGTEGLTPSQQQRWEAAQERYQKEYDVCTEDCGGEKACEDKCAKARDSRLEREYQRILHAE